MRSSGRFSQQATTVQINYQSGESSSMEQDQSGRSQNFPAGYDRVDQLSVRRPHSACSRSFWTSESSRRLPRNYQSGSHPAYDHSRLQDPSAGYQSNCQPGESASLQQDNPADLRILQQATRLIVSQKSHPVRRNIQHTAGSFQTLGSSRRLLE